MDLLSLRDSDREKCDQSAFAKQSSTSFKIQALQRKHLSVHKLEEPGILHHLCRILVCADTSLSGFLFQSVSLYMCLWPKSRVLSFSPSPLSGFVKQNKPVYAFSLREQDSSHWLTCQRISVNYSRVSQQQTYKRLKQ